MGFKGHLIDWSQMDLYSDVDTELYELTDRQAAILLSTTGYLGWKTRWLNLPVDPDLEKLKSAIDLALMSGVTPVIDCNDIEACLASSATIAAINAAIAANSANIATNSDNIANNQTAINQNSADININEIDIATNALASAQNSADIALQAVLIDDNAAQIVLNQTAITSNVNEINDLWTESNSQDVRITALEAGGGGSGGSGSILPATYNKPISVLIRSGNSTPLKVPECDQSHTFSYSKALITFAIQLRHYPNSGSCFARFSVDNVKSSTFQVSNGSVRGTMIMTQVFENIPVGSPALLDIEIWSTNGNYTRVETNQVAVWQIIEYPTATPILNSPLIDFENPDLYTLTALQDAIVTTGGNPDLCLRENPVSTGGYSSFEVDFGKVQTVTNIDFQWWVTVAGNQVVYVYGDDVLVYQYLTMQGNDAVWNLDNIPFGADFDCQVIRFHCAGGFGNDFRLDNFQIDTL